MLRKKKMLHIKHGCQGYQVHLTRDENIWRTWLRHKIIKKKKKKEQGRLQLPSITDEEKLLSLLFLVRKFSRKTNGSIKVNMFSFPKLTWNQTKALFSSVTC
jgi:hypothetical protein